MEVEDGENGTSAVRWSKVQGWEGIVEMEVEDGEDGASAGRVEGGADAPADHARPSEHAAAPAQPASASVITEMVLALERGDQALGGVPGGGSTDDASGSGSEGQQGSGTHLAGQVAVGGDGALVNIGKMRNRAKKGTGSSVSVQETHRLTMADHQFNEGKLDVKANILMWWKLHTVRFPYLSRLARRYLAMPATSVSVERLFSVAGQVVTAKRARLDPSTVTLLVFLHEAIPGGIERESYEIIESLV